MIVVEAVKPTPRELRGLRSGWGAMHWVVLLPLYIGFGGFLLFGLVAMGPDGDAYPPVLLIVFFGGTFIAWMAAYRLAAFIGARTAKAAPASGMDWRWTISNEGLKFESALQTNWTDWRAIKAVQEERDRFVFLLLPGNNPVLPKRLLAEDQLAAVRTLVAEARSRGVLGAGVD